MPDWKQCEGELVNGEFPLEQYLEDNATRPVFLTRFGPDRAVIRLEPANREKAEEVVKRWNRAAQLHHRNLAAIHAAGTCVLAGEPLAYVVTEYADENLADVLKDRPLTADEAREMLVPVADALAYLHGQGLVHGELQPSNVLAVGDIVKISSEPVSAGDPAEDIRALGVMLGLVFTQPGPAVTPGTRDAAAAARLFPFWELAEHCLHRDPQMRWPADKIAAWLRSAGQPSARPAAVRPPAPAAPAAKREARGLKPRHYAAAGGLLFVAAAVVGVMVLNRTAVPVPPAAETVRQAPAPVAPAPAPVAPAAPPAAQSDREVQPPRPKPAPQDEITKRVLPEVPGKARDTISGRPAVVVQVTVDPAGNVTAATLERSFSPYFGKLALDAARRWQFAPEDGAGPRNWTLRFEFTRTSTQVTPHKAGR